MKMVLYPPVDATRLSLIREAATGMVVMNVLTIDEALREIEDAEAFFGKLTPELLRAAKQLRWVQSPTASLEHYLFPELITHDLVLTNMRGLFSDVIADHVFGYILCFARNLHRYLRQQWSREWGPIGGEETRSSNVTGPGVMSEIDRQHQHLSDCTIGVVGVGAIGSEVLRRASAFGMSLMGVDPIVTHVADLALEIRGLDQLEELLEESDYVVIAAPQTPQTVGMFGTAQFQKMKRSAVLINIGRGAIVRLDALTQALRDREISGAALDVFEVEPLPVDHPLWEMEHVLLTPHIAAASPRVSERHTETLVENVRRFANHQPLINVVDKEQWF